MTTHSPLGPQQLLDQLFTAAPLGLAFLDTDLRYLRINDTLARYNGRPADDHLGRSVTEMLPELSKLVLAHYRRVLETGLPVIDVQFQGTTPAYPDHERSWQSSYFPVRDEHNAVAGICTIVQDVTARTVAEAGLRDRLRFEMLLAELTGAFVSLPAREVDKAITRHLKDVATFLGADRCVLWTMDHERVELLPTHFWHAPEVPPPPMDRTSADFPDTVERLFDGEVISFSTLDELPADGASPTYLADQGIRSGTLLPLTVAGVVEAMLAFGCLICSRSWTDEDIQRATILGGVFAGALQRRRAEMELREALGHNARLRDQLEAECTILREEISLQGEHEEIIGDSEALKLCLFRVEQVAPTDVTVLIEGETGSGKELIARALHRMSRRRNHPLITVNCAALPPTLIESELFGHERGAFTGADARRAGRFEVADGGTLFLDEIGELPPDLQVKLLRVLQEGEFQRLGSSRTLKSDVRIITATNRDLETAVREGLWREDLWYRLNVFPIKVPPLRDRKDDIEALASFFVKRFGGKSGRNITSISKGVFDALRAYDWPGNVRELENVIERAVITSPGPRLLLSDRLVSNAGPGSEESDLRRTLEEVERDYITRVLSARKWRIEGEQGAARALGLNPSTLRGRMRKLGIFKQ